MLLPLLLSGTAPLAAFAGHPSDIHLSYYSMVKLQHAESSLWLSSIEFNYQTGSHQQMTRGVKFPNLSETLWTLYPGLNLTHLHQGDPIKCGDRIRFYHAATRVWLQVREFPSPLDHGFEVSGAEGDNDNNDWIVQCNEDDGPTLESCVALRSAAVPCFLAATESGEYKDEAGGQFEVCCDDGAERNAWTVSKGIFVAGYADADEGAED
jgi:dolichyl-phosphate-mannose--protein O-mannosyl transferase